MNSTFANDYFNGPGTPPKGGAAGASSIRYIHDFSHPEKTLILSDGAYDGSPYNSGVNGNGIRNASAGVYSTKGSANICFLDGHVQLMKQSDVPTLQSEYGLYRQAGHGYFHLLAGKVEAG